jgi:hypothetical protein
MVLPPAESPFAGAVFPPPPSQDNGPWDERQPGLEDQDPVIDWMRKAWRNGEFDRAPLDPEFTALSDSVGPYKTNDRYDVAKVQLLLDRAGAYDLTPTDGPTGYFGASQHRATLDYQRDNNLAIDGLIHPGGETLHLLGAQAKAPQAFNDAAAAESGLPIRRPEDETQVAQSQVFPLIFRGAKAAAPEISAALRTIGAAIFGTEVGKELAKAKSDQPDPNAGSPAPPTNNKMEAPPPADPRVKDSSRFEALSDELVKEILTPVLDSRGDPTTQKGNDIVAKQCKDVVESEFPHLVELYNHFGGATKDGIGKKLKEPYIRAEPTQGGTKGSSRADLGLSLGGADNSIYINTQDTLADRETPDARERRNLAKLIKNVGDKLVYGMPKLRPGDDEAEYAKMAREKCRQYIKDAEEKYLKNPSDGKRSDDE